VATVDSSAFYNCAGLTNVVFCGPYPSNGVVTNQFYSGNNSVTTYVFNAHASSWDSHVTPEKGYSSATVASGHAQWAGRPIRTVESLLGTSGTLNFALDTPVSFEWAVSYTGWFAQGIVRDEGYAAARSGAVANNGSSSMQTTVMNEGVVYFRYRVSSEEGMDFLNFYVDGKKVFQDSGERAQWRKVNFAVAGPGKHALKWEYAKDYADSRGEDCAWVDAVAWRPGGTPAFPGGGGVPPSVTPANGTVTVRVTVEGYPDIVWQVSADGGATWTDIPGATSAELTLNGLTAADNGKKLRAAATDAGGTVYSAVATVDVPEAYATLSVYASPPDSGTVSGGGTYTVGSSRQISATASTGWHFSAWSDGSTSNPRAVTVPAGGAAYTATFAANTCTVAYNGNGSTGGSTAGSIHTYGTPSPLTANGFIKTGHSFAGWAAGAGGPVVHGDGAEVLNLTATQGATITLYAQWTVNAYTVTFDAQGGEVSPESKQVTYGTAYGALPTPARTDWYFAGWYTQPDGGGLRVKDSTVFTTAGDVMLYAKWVDDPKLAQDPYLADAGGGDAAPVLVTTAYEGFAYDEEGTVRGTVTLSAKAAVKVDKKAGTATTNWTFTAKAVLQSATVSFSAKATGSAAEVALAARTGETLDAALGTEAFYGTLEGGKVGGTLSVAGARNAFADRKDAAAQGRLAPLKGLYNVALLTSLSGSLSEPDGRLKGECAGYLALTVGNAGAVKLAGKLADGTAVSGAAKLLEGLNEDGWYAVALYKPLYAKKGFIGGLLWLNPEDGLVRVDADYGWCVDWVCGDVKKGVFERELGVVGGAWTGGGWGQPPYRFGASVPEELPPPVANLPGAWVGEAFPRELAVTVSGAKWSLPKATPPKKAGTEYDYSGANPSAATLAYTAKTGLFKGTFKLYWDGADAKGKAQHKTASVSYTGVLVPTEEGGFAGLGAGTATVNRQKVGIPVFLTE